MKKYLITTIVAILICIPSIILGAALYKYGYITKYGQSLDSFSDEILLTINNLLRPQNNSETSDDSVSSYKLITNNYEFNLTSYYTNSMDIYGGIDIYHDKLYFLDGQGNMRVLENEMFNEIEFPLVDSKLREFNLDFGVNFPDFSIKDMIFGKKDNEEHIFISHIEYDQIKKCYFLSVASSKINTKDGEINFDKFENLFQSKPCLGPHPEDGIRGFAGTSSGGKLSISKNGIYVSIGDFYFDGVNANNATNLTSDYGKIIFIDFQSSNKNIIASGLRNPQGMVLTSLGLFETEHGPQGGDEFNKINLNKRLNYGWPEASYGVDYETYQWPKDPNNNNHYLFKEPIYFWTPSIGVSNLDYFENESEFKLWRGDFLISSLRSLSLFRVRMDNLNENLIGIETINLGFRVRDIKIHKDKIYLLEDSIPVRIHILDKVEL